MKATRFKRVLFAAVAAMGLTAFGEAVKLTNVEYLIYSNGQLNYQNVVGSLHDNDFGTFPDVASGVSILLDCGARRHVTQIGLAARSGWKSRCVNFEVWTSDDAESWTQVHAHGGADVAEGSLTMVDLNVTARYFKFEKVYNGNASEIWLYSEDTQVVALTSADKVGGAEVFASTAVGAADHLDGVLVKGQLVYAQGDSASLVAVAAREDHGDDYNAWVADASCHSITLGEGPVAVGEKASGRFAGLEDGRWFWKIFAIEGDLKTASPKTLPFSLGTKVDWLPPAYAYNDKRLVQCYNGSVENGVDGGGSGSYLVFDLAAMPAGWHLDSVRVWPRPDEGGYYSSVVQAHFDLGYDNAGVVNVWPVTQTLSDGPRKVELVSETPAAITWQNDVAPIITSSPYNSYPFSVLFLTDTESKKPRYLRLWNQKIHFRVSEIEVRLAKDDTSGATLAITGSPQEFGSSDPAYGGYRLKAGVETSVTVAETEFDDDNGLYSYALEGWTLTRVSSESVTNVTEGVAVAGEPATCTFLPVDGESIKLVWNWQIEKQPVEVPARVTFKNNAGETVRGSAVGNLADHNFGTGAGAGVVREIVLDLRGRHQVTKVAVAPTNGWGLDHSVVKSGQFNVECSDDLVSWTTNATHDTGIPEGRLTVLEFENPVACRYVKLWLWVDGYGNYISEFYAYSRDVIVTSGLADPYANNDPAATDHADGVKVSATVYNSNTRNVDLVAFAAREELGESYADWLAKGVKIDLGLAVAEGYSRTGRFAGLEEGRWYWRTFALLDGDAWAGQVNEPFLVGSVALPAIAYVKDARAASRYDGVGGHGVPAEFNTDNWMVLDLSTLPPGYRLECLRTWNRTDGGCSERFLNGFVDLGYETDEGVDFGDKTRVSAEGAVRTVYQVAGYPTGVEWKTYHSLCNISPLSADTPALFFGEKDLKKRPRPRFLRVRGIDYLSVNEYELRCLKNPTGMAIIVK